MNKRIYGCKYETLNMEEPVEGQIVVITAIWNYSFGWLFSIYESLLCKSKTSTAKSLYYN